MNAFSDLSLSPIGDGMDYVEAHLLIQTQGKCSIDHILMACPWIRFRALGEYFKEYADGSCLW